MPEIAPLKGLLYNQKLIGNMAEVITPPFDVISAEDQEEFPLGPPRGGASRRRRDR